MKLHCYFCSKPVSTKVPDDTVVRAVLTCPECIEKHCAEDKLVAVLKELHDASQRPGSGLLEDWQEEIVKARNLAERQVICGETS